MTLAELLTAAVADFEANGYDSEARLDRWAALLRAKAAEVAPSTAFGSGLAGKHLRDVYERLVTRGGVIKTHGKGVSAFTLDMVKPKLRSELDRRLLANAALIKLNRTKATEQTLQRFSGWATSIPAGGSGGVDTRAVKADLRKSLAQLPFVERRLAIDQGHKLAAAIGDVVAEGGNAIAAEWRSHYRQPGYKFRPDHKERDGRFYAIRGSWAIERGLINRGAGYTDEQTKPAEEPFCRCQFRYVYALRDLPVEMITARGRLMMDEVRGQRMSLAAD